MNGVAGILGQVAKPRWHKVHSKYIFAGSAKLALIRPCGTCERKVHFLSFWVAAFLPFTAPCPVNMNW